MRDRGCFEEDLATTTYEDMVARLYEGSAAMAVMGTFILDDMNASYGAENVDATIGYRFPRRLGIASLSVSNLFDTSFRYQDDSFREFGDRPSIGPYIPDRQIVGRITLNW